MPSFSLSKTQEVVLFSSTAIALYGYDQGMMSLINTNEDYLHTMGIGPEDPMVGILVAVYYLGCSLGAVLFSWLSDNRGRKKAIFACLATASLGNLIMFVTGLGGWTTHAIHMFWVGRVIMGLGVGGIDAVIPVFSSELSSDGARGKALAQEFQMNIFGLNMAFAINIAVTHTLGKSNQWAWRTPIVAMQVYPALLFLVIGRLPESPRWFIFHGKDDDAKEALIDIYGDEEGEEKAKELFEAHEKEKDDEAVTYTNMLTPGKPTFHPTVIVLMGQVNQALTGYGAVSVYGPQIFEVGQSHRSRHCEYSTDHSHTASGIRRQDGRVHHTGQLRLLFLPHDLGLDSYRRSRPSQAPPRRQRSPYCLLRPAHAFRRAGHELVVVRGPRRARDPRHGHAVHRDGGVRHRLARDSVAHPNRDLRNHCEGTGLCDISHCMGACKLCRDASEPALVQQPQVLDLPHLRGHERLRRHLDLRLPPGKRRAQL